MYDIEFAEHAIAHRRDFLLGDVRLTGHLALIKAEPDPGHGVEVHVEDRARPYQRLGLTLVEATGLIADDMQAEGLVIEAINTDYDNNLANT